MISLHRDAARLFSRFEVAIAVRSVHLIAPIESDHLFSNTTFYDFSNLIWISRVQSLILSQKKPAIEGDGRREPESTPHQSTESREEVRRRVVEIASPDIAGSSNRIDQC